MKTINNNVINEIVINKSRFITCIYRCNNEKLASNYLEDIKKNYKDATHYCYAYVIGNTKRFNDDGEPSGTAGIPIMDILNKNSLDNIICIVIRYFGGIKLGAGGLIRAYSRSTREALKKANIIDLVKYKEIEIIFNYDDVKNVDYIINDCVINNKKYDDRITYSISIPEDKMDDIIGHLSLIKNVDIFKKDN